MREKPSESDWKTFRKRVPEWRERYLNRKNQELISILSDENKAPTKRFWDAQRKMEEEAKILTTCLDGHSRSKMAMFLVSMYNHKLIEDHDLDEFSDDLREWIL
ncbi:MAG: hypothetical protein KDA84_27000 [Planctomycetaceae bacterium]|nr:hypothetical protein [Planctomycetaceae bacterium]